MQGVRHNDARDLEKKGCHRQEQWQKEPGRKD